MYSLITSLIYRYMCVHFYIYPHLIGYSTSYKTIYTHVFYHTISSTLAIFSHTLTYSLPYIYYTFHQTLSNSRLNSHSLTLVNSLTQTLAKYLTPIAIRNATTHTHIYNPTVLIVESVLKQSR